MRDEVAPITDDMLFGAAVGWRLAHDEACRLGPVCSAHQPISATAQKPRLVAALVAAQLPTPPADDAAAAGASEGGGRGA